MSSLSKENEIIEKVYGKAKVYMIRQTTNFGNIKAELRDMDEKIIICRSRNYSTNIKKYWMENIVIICWWISEMGGKFYIQIWRNLRPSNFCKSSGNSKTSGSHANSFNPPTKIIAQRTRRPKPSKLIGIYTRLLECTVLQPKKDKKFCRPSKTLLLSSINWDKHPKLLIFWSISNRHWNLISHQFNYKSI